MSTDIDRAVAKYREQLSREADLGEGLDEIEDHLRLLIDDLQARGMPVAQAITEAAKRLGDPRELAREHARVRTPFGAKLPWWRALAVIALVLPQLFDGMSSPSWIDTGSAALGFVLCGALVWRSAWSRAALFGMMAWSSVWTIANLALFHRQPDLPMVALQLPALALLVPWRRADLTPSGWALALLYPMYTAATYLLYLDVTTTGAGFQYGAKYAVIGILLTGAGLVVRARWAALAAAMSTFILLCWFSDLFEDYVDFLMEYGFGGATTMSIGCAFVAGIAVTILAWRTARSNLGSLRSVAS